VDIFLLQVENGQCQTKSKQPDTQNLERTESDEWKHLTFQLKAGLNFLYWRFVDFSFLGTNSDRRVQRIIALQSVEING